MQNVLNIIIGMATTDGERKDDSDLGKVQVKLKLCMRHL